MPRIFRDKDGRPWSIEMTIGTVERIKATTRFDLYEPDQPMVEPEEEKGSPKNPRKRPGRTLPLQKRLAIEWSLFWELLYHLVEPQLTAAGINAEQFGQAMAAECLIAARQALFEEWRDFFLQLQEPFFAKALEMEMRLLDKALKAAALKADDPRLAELEQAAERKIAELMEKNLDTAHKTGLGNLRDK